MRGNVLLTDWSRGYRDGFRAFKSRRATDSADYLRGWQEGVRDRLLVEAHLERRTDQDREGVGKRRLPVNVGPPTGRPATDAARRVWNAR